MVKVLSQFEIDKYTILALDTKVLDIKQAFRYLIIDGVKYKAEIVYDAPYGIGLIGHGDFVGKEVQFTKE